MYGAGSNCRFDTTRSRQSDQQCMPHRAGVALRSTNRIEGTVSTKRMTKTLGAHNEKPSQICDSCLVTFVSVAQARSAYDGSWDLLFVTQRGACDPTYNFSVNITDGAITHPNLVRFRGHVAGSGAVHASVTVPDKYASGSGRLSRISGCGTWSGSSRGARCSGYWTAQRS
jgi:hypothetical protein